LRNNSKVQPPRKNAVKKNNMKKYVFVYGALASVVTVVMMFITILMMKNGTMNFKAGEVIGYTSMLVSFSMIFFGVRGYRDKVGNGYITFGRAFGLGVLIAVVASAIYVIVWLFIFYFIAPDFGDIYAKAMLEELTKNGAGPAEVEEFNKNMAMMRGIYSNPFTNAAVTFLEPFPIGVIASLITAAIVRKKQA
jgi:hypothetical protein